MPRTFRRSASRRACVDLPEPSPPSKVMNLPNAMADNHPSPEVRLVDRVRFQEAYYGSHRVARHKMESKPRRIGPARSTSSATNRGTSFIVSDDVVTRSTATWSPFLSGGLSGH